MFKFPWFTKRPQNNQSPGAIPGFLFRDGREEDDFVIIGETDSNELYRNSHLDSAPKPDMGTGVSSYENVNIPIHIDVQSAMAGVDNMNVMSSETSIDVVPKTPHRIDSSKLVTAASQKASDDDVDSVCENFTDCWRDIPIQLSGRYFIPPLEEINLTRFAPISWSEFQYDFSMERACIRSPLTLS